MILDEKFMYGVSDAIKRLRPNAMFELYNTTFTQWYDKTGASPPSWDEIMTQFEIDRVEYESKQYARDRVAEYLPLSEQLDQLFHAIESGQDLKNSEWFNHIKSVKDKYPKP